MTLSAVTLVLPRMVLDHLEEWLLHLRNHGFDEVRVFLDGDKAVDSLFEDQGTGFAWSKKPEANYHPDLSYKEVADRTFYICKAVETDFFKVHVKQAALVSQTTNLSRRQMDCVESVLVKQKEDMTYDWLLFCDVDEFVVCPYGLRKYLENMPHYVDVISMKQKLFENRFQEGVSVPMNKIGKNWGLTDFGKKVILRLPKGRGFSPQLTTVHSAKGNFVFSPAQHMLRFHHFRGKPVCPPNPNKKYKHEYTRMAESFLTQNLNDDFTHALQFINED